MWARTSQVSRNVASTAGLARPARRLHSGRDPLREYFVIVWDRPDADRRRIQQCDLVPPFCTFAGECMNPNPSIQPLAQGNGFACLARSVEEVQHKMRTSVYNTQGIWDLSTASISPLMTVHSSDYDAPGHQGRIPVEIEQEVVNVERAASQG
ncbi:hypothetical protein AB5N19_06503 [Seiridium cardinale]